MRTLCSNIPYRAGLVIIEIRLGNICPLGEADMWHYLRGKRISLTGLTPEHLRPDEPYYGWLNDLSLDLYSERSYFPNNPQRMNFYFETANSNTKLILLGIFDNATQRHIGNVTLQELDFINRRAFLGYLIGDKEFTGKGIASEACLMIMYYGFNKLNFERIWTTISAEHVASLKVGEHVGLKVEGRLREHQMRNGKRSDLMVVGALRNEWMIERGDAARGAFAELPV